MGLLGTGHLLGYRSSADRMVGFGGLYRAKVELSDITARKSQKSADRQALGTAYLLAVLADLPKPDFHGALYEGTSEFVIAGPDDQDGRIGAALQKPMFEIGKIFGLLSLQIKRERSLPTQAAANAVGRQWQLDELV